MASRLVRFASRWAWVGALLLAVAGAGCSSSSAVTCQAPTPDVCGSSCVDLQTDPSHCGTCNVSCPAQASCTLGVCQCPTGQTRCGNSCVDLASSTANCGSCFHDCGLGTCAAGTCACNPSPVALCPADPATGTCVDTSTNGSNCGACGNVCVPENVCSGGTCQCLPPDTDCSGTCTNTQTDPAHCGSCTTACPAGQGCTGGLCVPICAPGQSVCNGLCVNLLTDPLNCGTCRTACASGQTCVAGACQAACTTQVCGGKCCADATPCCGDGSCPNQHQNFVGTGSPQTWYDCTPSGTYDLPSATSAASHWAPAGNLINANFACPLVGGGSLCVVWQKPLVIGLTDIGCGVWCYQGSLAGTLAVTSSYACVCPTTPGTDWF